MNVSKLGISRPWIISYVLVALVLLTALFLSSLSTSAQETAQNSFATSPLADGPTYSSPIVLSPDKKYVWVVNPDDDSVSVIGDLAGTPRLIKTIDDVGDEPQGVALDGYGHAYVVSPADNTVTVIEIDENGDDDPEFEVKDDFVTGAEPWNIVASPDGKHVYVANSVQDTITVIDAKDAEIEGTVHLRDSVCTGDDPTLHYQPRGLAVTADGKRLYVTRFLSFVKEGGVQANDNGREGMVCLLEIEDDDDLPEPVKAIPLAPQVTGFVIDANADGVADPTSAYPNQLQSIVIRGNQAYLPNIAASPSRPLRFNVDTHAFVNVIDNASTGDPVDASTAKFLNLHLGARLPEAGKKRLFFANVWAAAFTNQSGAGTGYVVSAGSDLLVKVNVDADGKLSFTNGVSTTRYIDLNDPVNPATAGEQAGKNPLGIVIAGTRAFVMNFVSRNVSVVDLATDSVIGAVRTAELPDPGSQEEQVHVGAEIFFSSRGHFDRPAGTTVSTDERLSSEGWQSCSSCHFAGWTDGVVWQFGAGPRKSVPLNATFNPHNRDEQRILNYSAIFDEVQDFELNIRNVSGPGPLAAPVNGSVFDPNHGLIVSDTTSLNFAPRAVPPFIPIANAGRPQHTVTLPGSTTAWPALDAMNEWVRFAIRTPNGVLTGKQIEEGDGDRKGGISSSAVNKGKKLFFKAGCDTCHNGGAWTRNIKDFVSPPIATDVITEADLNGATVPNPNGGQFLARFLVDIGSYNLNVPGQGNILPGQPAIGGVEVDTAGRDGLGLDFDGNGKGAGFNIPSLLGIWNLPPYYHNGACETLACVLADVRHRTGGRSDGKDVLDTETKRARLLAYLMTIDAETDPPDEVEASALLAESDDADAPAGSENIWVEDEVNASAGRKIYLPAINQ